MFNLKKYLLVILVSFFTYSINANAVFNTQTYFDTWAGNHEIVGSALAINNQIYVYGYEDKALGKRVTDKTQFGLGSITKTFVSVIILKLEAKNKLNIHDPITKYLPQYPKLKNITIQSLMQMTAGFNDVSDDSVSALEQINTAYQKYNYDLNKTWRYSNVSYQLLGILIEKITHQSLAKAISTFITSPLHLHSIYFPNSSQAMLLKQYQNNQIKYSNFRNAYAAGGLVSNAKDLEKFIYHLFIVKDLLPKKQYIEFTTFIETSSKYYAFTHMKTPQFGLGVFRWNIPPYGWVLNYSGVLEEGFTSAYTVIGNNIIISQSNTYNNNDFTLLWPYRSLTINLIKNLNEN